MALEIYNVGLDALADWETADYHWMLITSGSFERYRATVTQVLSAATEATVASYARQVATTKVRTVNDGSALISYDCDSPTFGTLEAGETITAIALVRTGATDDDSIPVAWGTITDTPTDTVDPFAFTLTGGNVAYLDQPA